MRASSTESSTASANTVSICFQRSFVIAGSLPAPHPRDGLVLGLPPQRDHAHISAYKQNTLYTVSTGIPFCRRLLKSRRNARTTRAQKAGCGRSLELFTENTRRTRAFHRRSTAEIGTKSRAGR